MLRKDFIVDVYQVYETAAAGADALLLICAALSVRDLTDLYGEAQALDLDVLVEVHDERELELALEAIDADVIGINNRDLTDFSVDLDRTYELLSEVPAGKTVVSESGIHSRDQLDDLERVGVDAVLVGEALMRATDMADAATLVGHERKRRGGSGRRRIRAALHARRRALASEAWPPSGSSTAGSPPSTTPSSAWTRAPGRSG